MISLQDQVADQTLNKISPIIGYVNSKFEEAKSARRTHDYVWLDCYRNVRGVVDTNTTYIGTEVSKAFIKITKTKMLAAYGQLLEVLFAEKTIPIEIVPSDEPVGVEESVYIDPKDPVSKSTAPAQDENSPMAGAIGYHGDGNDLKPGDTLISRGLNYLKKLHFQW